MKVLLDTTAARRGASGTAVYVAELAAALEDEGVVRFAVGVELTNALGDLVAEMTVRWHVRRTGVS